MILFIAALMSIAAHADSPKPSPSVSLDQLKIDMNKNTGKLSSDGKPIIGRCDGKNFTDNAAYQGCLRNYHETHDVLPKYPDPAHDSSYETMKRRNAFSP